MAAHTTYLTREGLKKLEAELDYLRRTRRHEVADRLRAAIDEGGDLRENAEYESAKNEQSFVEGRILQLETMLSDAVIIQNNGAVGIVSLGRTVHIQEENTDNVEIYQIVGAAEANPSQGRISNESPIGQALLDQKVGDIVTVKTPVGELLFEIIEIVN